MWVATPSSQWTSTTYSLPVSRRTINVDDAQLKFATVCAITGYSESTIRRSVAAGSFPAPIRRGARCTRFRAQDVRKWLAEQS